MKFKKYKLGFLSFLLFLTLLSCDKESTKNNENSISKTIAVDIAKNFALKNSKTSKGIDITKTIKEFSTYKTDNQEDAFFIINYNEGGFVIIAADNRISPILAYSDTDDFKLNLNELPPPILEWIGTEKDLVEDVKLENLDQDPEIKTEWDYVLNKIPPPLPNTCDDIFYQKGPLLSTTWDQGCGYNNLLEDCSNNNSCNKVLTGCVATAMAQIMKYHHKPNSYQWAAMPSYYGTYATQNLMKDVGNAVNMHYGCTSSWAYGNDITGGFHNLGYNAETTTNFTTGLIMQQIDWNRPVLLSGGRKKSNISWNMYTDGHSWVCDGYQYITIYNHDGSGNCDGGVSFVFLHMNWGWSGLYNSWFNAWNFNPGTHTYNYGRQIVYNITPS